MAFRLYVFDLDGTLIDSRRDLADATNALLDECGAAPLPEERIGRMVGDGAATLVARAFDAAGINAPRDALARYLAIYDRHLLDHTTAYEGIPEALEALGARAALAVLTNKPLGSTRRILDGLGLSRHFAAESILGGDGPFPRKPDPAGLGHLVACARVEAAATVLVGDSVIDWRTALAAATASCVARYGFGFAGFPESERRAIGVSIESPYELLGL